MLYLLHASQQIGSTRHTAQHYLGYCEDGSLSARIARHRAGEGARITAAFIAAGASLSVVRAWNGTRKDERRLKQWHAPNRLCPLCKEGSTHVADERGEEISRIDDVKILIDRRPDGKPRSWGVKHPHRLRASWGMSTARVAVELARHWAAELAQ